VTATRSSFISAYFAARYGTSWFSNVSFRSIMPRSTYSLWKTSRLDVSDLSRLMNPCSKATRAGVERGATWINRIVRTGAGGPSATGPCAKVGSESAPKHQSTPNTTTTNIARWRWLNPNRMTSDSKNAAVTHDSFETGN